MSNTAYYAAEADACKVIAEMPADMLRRVLQRMIRREEPDFNRVVFGYLHVEEAAAKQEG